jgi:hypothetical protein
MENKIEIAILHKVRIFLVWKKSSTLYVSNHDILQIYCTLLKLL